MIIIFSVGFTKKKAEDFFNLLMKNGVKKVIDVRLNNSSQLAGFSKGSDLQYFLKEICNMEYSHEIIFAPTKEILDEYKKGKNDWEKYEEQYYELMKKRNIQEYIAHKGIDYWKDSCFLCSEEKPEYCHRRLAIKEVAKLVNDIQIKHL